MAMTDDQDTLLPPPLSPQPCLEAGLICPSFPRVLPHQRAQIAAVGPQLLRHQCEWELEASHRVLQQVWS